MKAYNFTLIFLCISFRSICQDTIQIIGLGNFEVNVLNVTSFGVRYTLFEEPSGTVYTVVKSAVLSIHYHDGSFEDLEIPEDQKVALDTIQVNWAEKGQADADSNYYGDHAGAFLVGCATVVFTPFLGWIPALFFASFPPSESHLNIMDYKLRRNKSYYESYLKRAHKIKRERVFRSYTNVTTVWFLLVRIHR